jgi:hypothetical protein
MANTASHATRKAMREEIERLVGQLDARFPPALIEAMQSLLTAIDYDDVALMRSQVHASLEGLQQVVHESIQRSLGWPQRARDSWRTILGMLKGLPYENWDEAGKPLVSGLDGLLKNLSDLRDGAVKPLQKHGYEVENAAQLENTIRELQELKEGIVESWPWSDRELPPVDRAMVAESRAAIKRGEGEPIEDLIRRLGGDPAKGG